MLPARGRIDARNLHISTQFTDRNLQRHEMDVVAALRILPGVAELKQIKDGLDVGKKAIVTLSSEGLIAAGKICDCLTGITVELSLQGDTILCRILAVVALVIVRRCDSLIVRWHDSLA